MNYQEFKAVSTKKLNKLSLTELQSEVKRLMNDHGEGVALVWNVLIDVVESKMSESDFIEFCDNL
jgi:hypothetical protein